VGSWGWLRTVPQLLTVACAVVAANVWLFARIAKPTPLQLLNAPGFFAADVATVAVLNLWASATVPQQSLYLPYHDLFFPYAWGTVALWTGLHSPLTGAVLLVGGQVPLQLGMARLNGFTLGAVDWGAVADRDLWLLASFLIAAIVAWLAREAAWASASEGVRAGREAERARTLRGLHDTVLQTLEGLALRAATADRPAEDRLREVRAVALQQAR
jgi:signal transduction histidine kinase